MTALEFHPLANIFPLVEGAEFDELVGGARNKPQPSGQFEFSQNGRHR